jgi:hypothetical protein
MFGTVPYMYSAYDQIGPVAAAPQPVKTERGEAGPATPMHMAHLATPMHMVPWATPMHTAPAAVPEPTPSFLNLADVQTFYARETVKVVRTTRAMLMTPRGRAAATKHVGYLEGETPSQFAARVIGTANPTALFTALATDGISENETRSAYHCCWVSTALRFAKRCREFPNLLFDRVGNSGNTILSLAVTGEAEIAVFWLLHSGASPRSPNTNGTTALSRGVERCVQKCLFAIDECVHERMKILMLCDAGDPRAGDVFADAMLCEMTRAVDEPKKTAAKQKRKSKK